MVVFLLKSKVLDKENIDDQKSLIRESERKQILFALTILGGRTDKKKNQSFDKFDTHFENQNCLKKTVMPTHDAYRESREGPERVEGNICLSPIRQDLTQG